MFFAFPSHTMLFSTIRCFDLVYTLSFSASTLCVRTNCTKLKAVFYTNTNKSPWQLHFCLGSILWAFHPTLLHHCYSSRSHTFSPLPPFFWPSFLGLFLFPCNCPLFSFTLLYSSFHQYPSCLSSLLYRAHTLPAFSSERIPNAVFASILVLDDRIII